MNAPLHDPGSFRDPGGAVYRAGDIPLDSVVDWIIKMAPAGVIEFPDKGDPMVQQLLALREDIFPEYDREHFVGHVARRARILRQESLGHDGRLLVWFDRT
jgi:hypothetical protein